MAQRCVVRCVVVVSHSAVSCGVVLFRMVRCDAVWCWCGIVCDVVRCGRVLRGVVWFDVVGCGVRVVWCFVVWRVIVRSCG